MVQVEIVDIDLIFSLDFIRVASLQPFIVFNPALHGPFKWLPQAVPKQIDAIENTFRTFWGQAAQNQPNFILFPEYSIPGLIGINLIESKVVDPNFNNNSIVLAGIEGLSKIEYHELCNTLALEVSEHNDPDNIGDTQWVNCCVIWTKDNNGGIRRWVQPKIRPAWPEKNVLFDNMFCGETIYVFKGKYENQVPCYFLTFLCFDWIAREIGESVVTSTLEGLNNYWKDSPRHLNWVFVLQHNDAPNHDSFLLSTNHFLTDSNTFPFVLRSDTAILHINTAISEAPCKDGNGGFTSCIISPNIVIPRDITAIATICMQPILLRKKETLRRCHDIVFREMGECIHTFNVRIPTYIGTEAQDRTIPIYDTAVYPTHTSFDPRLPGLPVAASIKWLNDSLDKTEEISSVLLRHCPLEENAKTSQNAVVSKVRNSTGERCLFIIECSVAFHSNLNVSGQSKSNPDQWALPEVDGLQHLIHTLSIFGLNYDLDILTASLHATIETESGFRQIVAIRGNDYSECRTHFSRINISNKNDPIVVVARDRDNLIPLKDELLRIDETEGTSSTKFVDYSSIINYCRTSPNLNDLKSYLDGILSSSSRII